MLPCGNDGVSSKLRCWQYILVFCSFGKVAVIVLHIRVCDCIVRCQKVFCEIIGLGKASCVLIFKTDCSQF